MYVIKDRRCATLVKRIHSLMCLHSVQAHGMHAEEINTEPTMHAMLM